VQRRALVEEEPHVSLHLRAVERVVQRCAFSPCVLQPRLQHQDLDLTAGAPALHGRRQRLFQHCFGIVEFTGGEQQTHEREMFVLAHV
jgi:hypothetical protein